VRLVFCLLAVCVAPVRAQTEGPALWLTGGVAVPLGGGIEGWTSAPGLAGRVETPAYGGRARLSVRAVPYEETEDGRPPFWLVVPAVGWTRSARLPGGVEVGVGAAVGVALFRFGADDEFPGNLQNETEVAVGALARLDGPVGRLAGGRLAVWAEAEATHVVLARARTLATATAGLSVRLDGPRGAPR
jgi:hypothetical protein